MNARIVTTATIFTAFAGMLTARAADSQLLSMVMPDAKVVAGVNVDQAKASPFGLFVLTEVQAKSSDMAQLAALTNFDPTRDVHELLAATTSTPDTKSATGLVLARGNFDVATITALAVSKGAVTEQHHGQTIIEDPKKLGGVAFINSTLAVFGDVANVKAAIDRPSTGQTLPAAVQTRIGEWSNSSDAWMITTVAPGAYVMSGLATGTAAPLLQQMQLFSAGVKFGNNVVGTAVVQTDTTANATQMANALQFLVNMAQMQSQKDAQLVTLLQGVAITSNAANVKLTVTLPQAQFQQLIAKATATPVGPAVAPQVRVKK
jgi:hypothetical protein